MFARTRALIVATSLLIGAGVVLAPLPASAEDTPALQPLLDFAPSDFAAEAATLPQELVVALAEDVELTPEEYLAQGAAATQAVAAVEALQASGIGVLGSRLDGLELVVNVSTEAEAEVVESIGAIAELGAPEQLDLSGIDLKSAADVYDGQGWVWSPNNFTSSYLQCSIGFTGYALPSGTKEFATAGHCTKDMVASARIYNQTQPGKAGTFGDTLGTKVASTSFFGSGRDVGRVTTGASNTQKSSVLNWGGARSAPLASAPKPVTGDAAPIVGGTLCKSGSRTGWACGPIVAVDYAAPVDTTFVVNSVVAELCVLPGDSGGVAIVGSKAVGITSWTSANTAAAGNVCIDVVTPEDPIYGGFFQMVSTGGQQSVATAYGSTWEMAATVSAPTITSIARSGGSDTAISGTVLDYGRNYKVDIFIDGSSTPVSTANVNAANGTWTASVTSVPAGVHTFSAVARYGTFSKSSGTTGYINRGMTVSRIDGSDRYAVGVKIAQTAYPSGNAPVVYVTTGLNYPDALSAAPAAALEDGVLLLTAPAALPAAVRAEIVRLSPDKIIVVGGVNSVSPAVLADLKSIQSDTVRWAGADRYEASRTIVRNAFLAEQPSTAYIATGLNFPDALSASAAGGAFGYPVILVNGLGSTVDAATLDLLDDLGVTEIKIAGGPNSVSNGILNGLKVIDPTPTRLAGADRFEASMNIAVDAFGSVNPQRAYIATGFNFPDALAGAPLAGANSAPLVVVPTTCVPASTLGAFKGFGTRNVTLLGGTVSLTSNVQALRSC